MSREKVSSRRIGPKKPRGSSMLTAALLSRVRENGGGQEAYAKHLGVSRSSIMAWINNAVNPLHRYDTRDKIIKDLGMGLYQLTVLADISIREACDIVLEAKASEDPLEQELHDRFFGLMVEHGTAIPPAAFMIYLTGDQENRRQMIELLEEQEIVETRSLPDSIQASLDAPKT